MIARSLATLFTLLFTASMAHAQADHLQCFKIKDSAAKAAYQADLTPTDNAFLASAGCTVKVPAKLLCIDVQKSNVTPPPPGSPAGAAAQKYLCYKVKCPKQQLTTALQDQFGTHALILKPSSLLCAPEPAPASTTTTTTGCPNINNDGDGHFAPPCGLDCDDNDPSVYPGAPEICNTVDDDCDGNVDEGFGQEICNNGIDDDCDATIDEPACICFTHAQCPSAPNAPGQCQAGMCTFICDPGYANCNVTFVDGCEVNTTGDPNNCGGCNLVCPLAFPNCVSSVCQ